MRIGPYAVEQDYSQYVQSASDLIYAVVGTATKGPINKPVVCTSTRDLIEKFGNLNPNCLGIYAAYYFLNQSSKLWFVRAAGDFAKKATVKIAGKNASDGDILDALVFEALEEGTHYNGYTVTVELNPVPEVAEGEDLPEVTGDTFNLLFKNSKGTLVNSFTKISLADAVNISTDDFKFSSKYETATVLKVGTYTFVDGNDGIAGQVTVEGTEGSSSTEDVSIESGDYIKAIKTLESDTIDTNLVSVPGVSDIAVVQSMIETVEKRADALYLVDAPYSADADDIVDWHNGTGDYTHGILNSSFAALYHSWQRIYDPYNKIYIEVPPSVVVAPTIARSSQMTEIWYAPAGLTRGLIRGVAEPVFSPDTNTVNTLYSEPNNVNCIINDPQAGLCIFGQKTLYRMNSSLNRVNVRLLLNYLKRVIVGASKYLTFEPNDRVTWNNFQDLVEPVLRSIQSLRGIYEYEIVKGEAIVTDTDIDNYRMPCKVLIRPTKAAEEIPIYFTLTSTGADFNEVLENEGIEVL